MEGEGRGEMGMKGGRKIGGEECVIEIALVVYCGTHHNSPCPVTRHHCRRYVLAENVWRRHWSGRVEN
jgi:hypothetical protein